jgi:hypothetical protein
MGLITVTAALGPGLFETFTGDLSTKMKKVLVELPRTIGCLRARAAYSLFPALAELDLIVEDKWKPVRDLDASLIKMLDIPHYVRQLPSEIKLSLFDGPSGTKWLMQSVAVGHGERLGRDHRDDSCASHLLGDILNSEQ